MLSSSAERCLSLSQASEVDADIRPSTEQTSDMNAVIITEMQKFHREVSKSLDKLSETVPGPSEHLKQDMHRLEWTVTNEQAHLNGLQYFSWRDCSATPFNSVNTELFLSF